MNKIATNLLNFDYKDIIPYAIEAFTKVYGEEYYPIISQKLQNMKIVHYNYPDGIYDYAIYLSNCKRNELNLRFLEEIGIDVENYKQGTFAEKPHYDEKAKKILDCFIETDYGFSKLSDYMCPLRGFSQDNNEKEERKLQLRLKLINGILGDNHKEITKESFDEFSKTEEYSKIMEIINKYLKIYEKLLVEYQEFLKTIEPYNKYYDDEFERKKEIFKEYKIALFLEVIDKLPEYKSFREKRKMHLPPSDAEINNILGSWSISWPTTIEEYTQNEKEELEVKDSLINKLRTITPRIHFLKQLGLISADDTRFFEPDGTLKVCSQEGIDEYISFINQDHIKEYLPKPELVEFVKKTRTEIYEQAKKSWITTRNDFINCLKMFSNGKESIDYFYNIIKDNRVCITASGGTHSIFGFFSVMFYTVRACDGGYLAQSFLHECGHAIDQNKKDAVLNQLVPTE